MDIMLGLIALTAEVRTLDEYIQEMENRDQDAGRRNQVRASLKKYADALQTKKILPVGKANQPLR